MGGGRFNFPAGVGRRVERERNGGGMGKAKRQNGIVGCREGTGGRRALAGMIVGRERGIVELGGRESSTGIPHGMGTSAGGG